MFLDDDNKIIYKIFLLLFVLPHSSSSATPVDLQSLPRAQREKYAKMRAKLRKCDLVFF